MNGVSGQRRRPLLVVDDGRPGHLRQSTALAEGLAGRIGTEVTVLRAPLDRPWCWTAPRGGPFGRRRHLAQWHPPQHPPQAVIAAGRQGALAARWLRDVYRDSSRDVPWIQILQSGLRPGHADAHLVPWHDVGTHTRAIRFHGSLNAIDDGWLEQVRARTPEWGERPAPRIAVIVGGPARGARWSSRALEHALRSLSAAVEARQASLFVAALPRTPSWATSCLQQWLRAHGGTWVGWPDPDRRYDAMLAHATHVAVTPDSVNALSEAAATGRPVRVLMREMATGKRARYLDQLESKGYLCGDDWLRRDTSPPLRERDAVLDGLRERLGDRLFA